MTKPLRIGLILLFLFQLFIAAGFELAHDEAYYWLFSRHLDWGYFDHPPFVAAVIKLFSFLPHTEWAVRIGFILLQFGSLALLLSLTSSSLMTVLLFFSFPLASFTGLLALPDIPLLFMTACYCVGLKRYLEKDSIQHAAILGLIIALLFYAKYHGVLLIFFTILAVPGLFKKKSFYLVAVVAVLAFLPHMYWQYEHQFATLRYHFIERPSSKFSVGRTFEYVGLQILLAGVFAGPVVWWLAIRKKTANAFDRSMKFISIGTIIFFFISSLSKKVEANWTIFLAVPLIYLTADAGIWKKRWARSLLLISFGMVVFTRIILVLPPEKFKLKRLNEFHGWKSWAQEVQTACGNRPILANTYQIASKLSYYLDREIGALNYHSRKNHFDYWRLDRRIPTEEVCYVTDQADMEGETLPTPEGKNLRLVKNETLSHLRALKYGEYAE